MMRATAALLPAQGKVDRDRGLAVERSGGKLTFTNSLGTVEVAPEQESFAAKDKKPADARPTEVQRELRDFIEAESSHNSPFQVSGPQASENRPPDKP